MQTQLARPSPACRWLDRLLGPVASFSWGALPGLVREPDNWAGDERCVAANASLPLANATWGWSDASCDLLMTSVCRLMGRCYCSCLPATA